MSLPHLENGKESLELRFDIMNVYLNLRSNACQFSPKRLHCTSFKAARFRFRAMASWGQLELMRNSRFDQVWSSALCSRCIRWADFGASARPLFLLESKPLQLVASIPWSSYYLLWNRAIPRANMAESSWL